jgi:hypothetical protein
MFLLSLILSTIRKNGTLAVFGIFLQFFLKVIPFTPNKLNPQTISLTGWFLFVH